MKLNIRTSGDAGIFCEVLRAFELAAREAGHDVAVVPLHDRTEGVNIYFVGHGEFLNNPDFVRGSVNVLYNFEQRLPSGYEKFDYVLNVFKHIEAACVMTYCPLGHSSVYDRQAGADDAETVDVFHAGDLREGLKGETRKSVGDLITDVPQCFGTIRDSMILKSKINVIIQTWPGYHFPVLRFLLIASKRKFVLTEAHESYSLVDHSRILTIVNGDLRSSIQYWLKESSERRQTIADDVYAELKKHPYSNFVHNALVKLEKYVSGGLRT